MQPSSSPESFPAPTVPEADLPFEVTPELLVQINEVSKATSDRVRYSSVGAID